MIRSYVVVGALEERAAVVDVDVDPRVLVGLVGVLLLADLGDPRVDLDGVDVLARPCVSARATSVPVPAPTISTFVERVVADALVGHEVVRVDLDALSRPASKS